MAEESIQVFHTCMSFILTRESTIHPSLLRKQARLLKLCYSVPAFTLLISCAVFMSSQHEEDEKKKQQLRNLLCFILKIPSKGQTRRMQVNNEQFGIGNKKGKKRGKKNKGEKGRAILRKRLCNVELGVKEEWEGKMAEVQESQSRREIHMDVFLSTLWI